MTVTNENSRNDYVSNGSAVEYAFTFKILDEQDIQVIVLDLNGVEEVLTLTTDYTVDIDEDTGLGSITLVTAVASGFAISLLRNMDFEQNTSIQNQGTSQFSGKSFEQALDKVTLLALQLKENIARSILLPKSSQLTELEIPVNLANAGKAVIVNAAGDNLEVRNLMDISAAAFSSLGLELVNTATAAAMRTLLGVQALNATLTDLAARVVGNSSGNIPVVGSQSATTSLAGTSLLLSPITISNNATDANNDIDFSAGVFQFSDGSGRAIATAMTKRLDANWVAGTNQGGLDTGSKTTTTWYHCYAIYNPTTKTSDFLFSTGATAPTALPSGFTKYKWVGAILNTSGNVILPFIQDGKTITYNAVLIYDSPAIPTTPTAASCITPPGIRVKGLFNTTFDTSAQVLTNLIYTDPMKTSFSRIVAAGTPFNAGSNFEAFTNFSTYIFLSKSDANALEICKVYNYGWEIPDNLY